MLHCEYGGFVPPAGIVPYTNPALPDATNVADALDALADRPASGGDPGLLINGGLSVWQRGTSFTNPATQYTADRMLCDGTGTVTRHGSGRGMVITGTIRIRYLMEDIDYAAISGKTVTLSYSKGGIVTTSTYTATSATVVDITITNATVEWIKLELGGTATAFVARPYAQDLVLCKRYYEIVEATYGPAINNGYGTNEIRYERMFTVEKRIAGTLVVTSAIMFVNSAWKNVKSYLRAPTATKYLIYFATNNLSSAGSGEMIAGYAYTLDMKATVDAEIYP